MNQSKLWEAQKNCAFFLMSISSKDLIALFRNRAMTGAVIASVGDEKPTSRFITEHAAGYKEAEHNSGLVSLFCAETSSGSKPKIVEAIYRSKRFSISYLASNQSDLANALVGRESALSFEDLEFKYFHGIPYIDGGMFSLFCDLDTLQRFADNKYNLIVGRILDSKISEYNVNLELSPLVNHRDDFTTIITDSDARAKVFADPGNKRIVRPAR